MTLSFEPLEDALELCKVHGCHLGRFRAGSCFLAGRLGLGCGVLCRVRASLGFTLEASASGFRAVFSNPEVYLGMLSIETTPECHGIADIHTHTWLGCFRYFRASGREVEAVVTITIVVALIAVSAVVMECSAHQKQVQECQGLLFPGTPTQ